MRYKEVLTPSVEFDYLLNSLPDQMYFNRNTYITLDKSIPLWKKKCYWKHAQTQLSTPVPVLEKVLERS